MGVELLSCCRRQVSRLVIQFPKQGTCFFKQYEPWCVSNSFIFYHFRASSTKSWNKINVVQNLSIWKIGPLDFIPFVLPNQKFNPLQKYQEPCARPCDHHWAPEQEDSFVLAGDQGIFQMEWYGLHAQFGRLPYLVMSGKYGYTRLIWNFFFDWLISWLMNILVNIFGILAPRSSPLRHPLISWWTSPPTPPHISKWVLDT